KDIQKLAKHIQNKYAISTKEWIRPQRHTPIRELIMQALTWSDEEYNDYLNTRQQIDIFYFYDKKIVFTQKTVI
ncbi:MAG: hypothetical protein FWD60_07590, partial [Candidatus Azobacteroides sp.]|nr:hypothetical protein [Candidatus Azobacteroides sp.]